MTIRHERPYIIKLFHSGKGKIMNLDKSAMTT